MPEKTWIPWNNVDYSSASHNPAVKQKAYYDSTPSKSIGGGANMPNLGCDDAMWLNDPASPSPNITEVTVVDEIASGLTKEDRLAIVREWVSVKERELARRRDARFFTTCFIPVPNELSARDAVRVGHEICQVLFSGDHLYSFSVHAKETTIKKIAGNAVAVHSRQNNHIHIIFSERRLSDGKKGTGASRKFKQRDALRKMINSALSDALIRRGYKITANAGDQKKKRISRAQQRAREREEQQALAVQQAALEVKQKWDEITAMDKEIAVMEREVTAMEKGQAPTPSKQRSRSPQPPRQQNIDFDRLAQGMNSLKDTVSKDRAKQKEASRQRTQAPQHDHDRTERDGIDI